jgi:hypothetical protein
MAHWDLTDYMWSLGNLTDDITPALHRSCCLAAAWYVSRMQSTVIFDLAVFSHRSPVAPLPPCHAPPPTWPSTC